MVTPLIVSVGISLAVVATSFISGILGMAGGMILMGILLALLPVPEAMMLHGVTQLTANGWRALIWRREIDWRIFRGHACGALVVLMAFVALQVAVSRPVAYLILGATPFIGYGLPRKLELNVDRPGHSFACGMVCTTLSLAAGISGPLLDVFFLRSAMDRRGIVATKAASQTLVHLIRAVYFGALLSTGQNGVEWWFALAMAGLAVAGTSLSRMALEGITESHFRQWTRGVVSAMGMFFLCNGIWSLAHH